MLFKNPFISFIHFPFWPKAKRDFGQKLFTFGNRPKKIEKYTILGQNPAENLFSANFSNLPFLSFYLVISHFGREAKKDLLRNPQIFFLSFFQSFLFTSKIVKKDICETDCRQLCASALVEPMNVDSKIAPQLRSANTPCGKPRQNRVPDQDL